MVAGIDFNSYQVDVVLLSEDEDTASHLVYKYSNTGDAFDRARYIRDAMPSRGWWLDHCIAVGIEDPRGAARTVDSILYRVQGAILACLPTSLLVQPWKPGEWRKELGIANVGKEAPANFAVEHWQINWLSDEEPNPLTQDAYDAYCIAYATRQRLVRTSIDTAA